MKRLKIASVLLILALLLGLVPSALAAVGTGWKDDCRMNPKGDGYGKHNWVKQWEEAGSSCTSKGTATYRCSYCGASTTRETRASGHRWGGWKTTREATCTQNGTRTHTCKVCGKRETEYTGKAPHSWGEWTILVEATDHSPAADSTPARSAAPRRRRTTTPTAC